MFRDEQELMRAVQRLDINAKPDPDHREALRDQMLTAFREPSGDQAAPPRRHAPGQVRRFVMRSKPFRFAAAAAVAACVVATVLLWPGNGGRHVVLADVLALVEEAQTVCFKLAFHRDGQPADVADVKYKEPSLMRSEMPGMINVIDWSKGEFLVLMTEQKTAHKTSIDEMENPYHRDWLADLKEIIGDEAAQEVGRKEIADRQAIGWRVADDDGVCTVWADSRSGELLQVEFETGNTTMVMSEFEMGKPLDDSLFSLTPPSDYRYVTQTTIAASDPSIDDVALLLHVWALGNGGFFPDRLDARQFGPAAAKADWKQLGIKSQEEATAAQAAISRAFSLLYSRFDWSYAGKGVGIHEKDKPVFWYKPEGAEQCRVIYADLSIRDVAEIDLPVQTKQPE